MQRIFLAAGFVLLAAGASADPLPVHIVTAEMTVPLTEEALTGTLQAVEAFPVSFPQGGRVISVAVRDGDRVVAGQELARVDPTQADAALRAATATLNGADAALREAQQASDRAAELLSRGAGTRADVDTATKTLLAAQASRDQADAQLSKARTAQGNTVLTAPRAGTITARVAEPGQVVNPGQKVVSMAADAGLEAVFNAPDGVNLEAFLGDKVSLIPVDQPDLKARVDSAVPEGVVFGTPVIGRLTIPQVPGITLPWTALTALAGRPAVWMVEPATMTVSQVPVTVSAYGGDTVRLSGGIAPGTMVVTDGSQLLFPGRDVAPVKAGN